jgi:hypothetical protein
VTPADAHQAGSSSAVFSFSSLVQSWGLRTLRGADSCFGMSLLLPALRRHRNKSDGLSLNSAASSWTELPGAFILRTAFALKSSV